jgi:ribosomal protein S18 acetylase RimI-like enzyme
VQEKAAAAGACEVVLSTAHDNRSAQALYEIEGYRPDTEFRVYVLDLRP